LPRKRDIEAAIAAYNATDPEALLPPEAARLLAVMFRRSSMCQRGVADLAAEGFDRRILPRLLRALGEAGLLSKERRFGQGTANIYRLHLPPLVRRREKVFGPTRDDITAAVAAYDRANPLAPLPRNTARLLIAMFPAGEIRQWSLDAIAAQGFSRRHLPATLNRLVRLGFLTWETGTGGAPPTFQLHLPPLVRR
jgi:hypothetical protein